MTSLGKNILSIYKSSKVKRNSFGQNGLVYFVKNYLIKTLEIIMEI